MRSKSQYRGAGAVCQLEGCASEWGGRTQHAAYELIVRNIPPWMIVMEERESRTGASAGAWRRKRCRIIVLTNTLPPVLADSIHREKWLPFMGKGGYLVQTRATG